jgi:hypothetical protein
MSSNADSRKPGSYRVEVWEEVLTLDVPKLDGDVQRAAAEVVKELHYNPYLGDATFDEHEFPLPGCRKVKFDAPDKRGRRRKQPRFRLIYRNEPADGSIAVVAIIAIRERRNLIAYRIAKLRISRREGR